MRSSIPLILVLASGCTWLQGQPAHRVTLRVGVHLPGSDGPLTTPLGYTLRWTQARLELSGASLESPEGAVDLDGSVNVDALAGDLAAFPETAVPDGEYAAVRLRAPVLVLEGTVRGRSPGDAPVHVRVDLPDWRGEGDLALSDETEPDEKGTVRLEAPADLWDGVDWAVLPARDGVLQLSGAAAVAVRAALVDGTAVRLDVHRERDSNAAPPLRPAWPSRDDLGW